MRPDPSLLWLLSRTPVFWIGLVLAAFGAVMLVIGLWGLQRDSGPGLTERRAAALVSAKEIRRVDDGEGAARRAFFATLEFATAEGEPVRIERELPFPDWRELGEETEVAYAADAPERARPILRRPQTGAWVATGLIGALQALVGAGLLGWAGANARRMRRLAREGEMVAATVREIKRVAVRVNNRPQYRLVYEYQDWRGRTHLGQSRMGRRERFQTLNLGQGATIYVDRKLPRRSVWSGDLV